MQRRLHWKGGMLCDRVLCDCVMGGKKWMRLHFSSFLHCCSKPCSSSCRCTWLPSNIYGCFLWNIVTFHLTSGWCHLNDFSCMIFYPLDLHLCSDLFDNVPWPGGGGVPQVSPGLEAAISILLCPPTMCTTLVHLCTCAPMLYMHYLLKKGSVPRTWKCHLCSILSTNNCAICPHNCVQMCQLSAQMCTIVSVVR